MVLQWHKLVKTFEVIRLQKSDNSGPIVEPDVVLVNTDEVCAAIKDTYDECRSIVEPSGAMALAGIKNTSLNTAFKVKISCRLFVVPT